MKVLRVQIEGPLIPSAVATIGIALQKKLINRENRPITALDGDPGGVIQSPRNEGQESGA
jgi:hypothetical protein